MDEELNDAIRAHMSEKTTGELLKMWTENDRGEFSDETFGVLRQLLEERGQPLPPQHPAKTEYKRKKKERKRRQQKDGPAREIALEPSIVPEPPPGFERHLARYLSFDVLISPTLIIVIYFIGCVGIVVAAVKFMTGTIGDPSSYSNRLLLGLFLLVLGNVLWRVICEGSMVLFTVRDKLSSIDRKTAEQD